MSDREAFLTDTLHRMLVEAVRVWVIESHMRTHKLPSREVRFVYAAGGPVGIDWGNAPGPDDPDLKPLRYKRIRVTLEIEDHGYSGETAGGTT